MKTFKLEKGTLYAGISYNAQHFFLEGNEFIMLSILMDLPKEIKVLDNAGLCWIRTYGLPVVMKREKLLEFSESVIPLLSRLSIDISRTLLPVTVTEDMKDRGAYGINRIMKIMNTENYEEFGEKQLFEVPERYCEAYFNAKERIAKSPLKTGADLSLMGFVKDELLHVFIVQLEADLVLGYFKSFDPEQKEIEFD